MEDHVLKGGFGSAVLEELADMGLTRLVERIGWADNFIERGISVEATVEKALHHLKGKVKPAASA